MVGKNEKNLKHYVNQLETLLQKDYKVKPTEYKFKITNRLGKSKEYKFYYTIIPPEFIFNFYD